MMSTLNEAGETTS